MEYSFSGIFPVLIKLCHVPAGMMMVLSPKRSIAYLDCLFYSPFERFLALVQSEETDRHSDASPLQYPRLDVNS